VTIRGFNYLKNLTFSNYQKPDDQKKLSLNLLRASLQCTLATSATALISFAFKSYLPSSRFWQRTTSYSVARLGASLAMTSYMGYGLFRNHSEANDAYYEKLNRKLSAIETASTLVGLFGAAALKLGKKTSNRLFFPLLGLGVTGLTYKAYHLYQNNKIGEA
jgi:hypothetical protein